MAIAEVLQEVFLHGIDALRSDLNRSVRLRKQGKLGYHPWQHFCEGQFDMYMARGYEALADDHKAEMLPIAYRGYRGVGLKADLCFLVSSESNSRLCWRGETKFIRHMHRKKANESRLRRDALKSCQYMLWFFAGRPDAFLPADSVIARACNGAMGRIEQIQTSSCHEMLEIQGDDGLHRSFIGICRRLAVQSYESDMPPEYCCFLWVNSQETV